ncbi:hypothetical protein J2Z32_003765 [Paenibacillus turicensis]|uniref:Uncharacterized protein n=1 Tax=Paenibacillus turicensis TaxID=160487 RepID=A0ABS4FWZ8_9BACL|nr:hypothetical protein [Paenibacillus turicensis]MBP1907100.1 hypothetical protein [Paenibacillus turicensis]
MASGSLVGDCPYCGRVIFEDEWTLDKYGELAHVMCDYKAMLMRARDERLAKEREV